MMETGQVIFGKESNGKKLDSVVRVYRSYRVGFVG
jgi:hypothetical protein